MKKRKLYFHLPNKSKWVLSYSTKGIKFSLALNFTFMSIHVLEFAKMSWFSILANNNKQKRELPLPKKWQNWGSQKRFSSRDVMAIYHFSAQSTAKCQIWPFLFCDFFRQTFVLDFVSYIFSQSSQISFMRETCTKMAIAKSWKIRKTLILDWQNRFC